MAAALTIADRMIELRDWIESTAKGNPAPALAVAAALNFQRSQASRLIRAARDAGLPRRGYRVQPRCHGSDRLVLRARFPPVHLVLGAWSAGYPAFRLSSLGHRELWDLAQEGAGRRQQLVYATRQLVRAAPLRLAVLAPRSRKQPG